MMDSMIVSGLQKAKRAFPGVSFIVFGSRAKGTSRPDSDLDVCAVFPELLKDPFELAFEVRSEIHKYLDIALDVVVCDSPGYASRGCEQWTIEHSIEEEGVVV